ncbi:hypothetical protein SXCC_03419 [Gluconacetobacter sp. SXCC-1]|nr:hypothetical protein SXCC_03419 [Gluconacetobacter sp. SXCC-1]
MADPVRCRVPRRNWLKVLGRPAPCDNRATGRWPWFCSHIIRR